MSHPAFLTDPAHVSLSGVTGSAEGAGGKTSTANWWGDMLLERGHFLFMLSFDVKGGNYVGASVSNAAEAAKAIKAGNRRINWQPIAMGDLEEQHTQAVQFADGLNGPTVMIHDDAVNYADSAGLKHAISMAGNPSDGNPVKSLVVSQDMWDLPRKGIRSNIHNVGWVGPATPEMRRYFEVMKRPDVADQIEARHVEPFMWSVHDGMELHTYQPVPEEYST